MNYNTFRNIVLLIIISTHAEFRLVRNSCVIHKENVGKKANIHSFRQLNEHELLSIALFYSSSY